MCHPLINQLLQKPTLVHKVHDPTHHIKGSASKAPAPTREQYISHPKKHQPTGKVVAEDEGSVSFCTRDGISGGFFPSLLFSFALPECAATLGATHCSGCLTANLKPDIKKHPSHCNVDEIRAS
jgi:hypothetical protein